MWTKYSRELVRRLTRMWNVKEYTLRLYSYDAFLTLGCSVEMKHVVFKIKYDKYCKIELNDTFLVDQIYDFKSHKVLHINFVVFDVLDSQHCLRIFEWSSYILVLVQFKWACLIACCLSVFSHFLLLLQNHLTSFNKTWHKSSFGQENSSFFKSRVIPFSKGIQWTIYELFWLSVLC